MKRSHWIILGIAVFLSVGMLATAMVLRLNATTAGPMPTYTITFLDSNGTELSKHKVKEDGFAVPPEAPQHNENEVFLGWGNPLYPITADVTCEPNFQDISSGENVFFTDTVYIEKGKSAKVAVKVGGQVNLDELELEINYNPELIDFRSADSSFGEVKKIKNGEVKFTLAAERTLTSPTTIAEVEFKAIGGEFTYGEFSFEVPVAKLGGLDATLQLKKTQYFIYKR